MSSIQLAAPASVLVVDDNPLIVDVLKSLLGSQNYLVHQSSNGQEALDVLKSNSVDVIICDVMMPEMDGYELHRQVRSKSELSHIPFLFLTALGSENEIRVGKESGADDYLVKPFEPENLLAVVRGKLSRSRSLKSLSDEKYDSYRKKVLHTLSHEFRTPLVAINTGTELLIDQKDNIGPDKVIKLLDAIRRGGQRLEHLVNDFMLFQQIEAGVAQRLYDSRAHDCVVNNLVHDFVEAKAPEIEKEGFKLSLADDAPGVHAHIYEAQVQDILARLLSNAQKFSQSNKEIDIAIHADNVEIVLEVSDHGVGVDPAKIREAIDIFGQLNRDKLEQQGGGLGLAIASRFAAINKGSLRFENRPEGGAKVSIVLPRIPTKNS